MSYVLDITLLCIFLLVVLISARRGFVKSIWSLVTIIGAFVLAYLFGPALGEWVGENYVNDYVSSYTLKAVESVVTENSEGYDVSGLFDDLPEEFVDILDRCGVEIDDITAGLSPTVTTSQEELQNLAASIAAPVSGTISNLVGVIVVFFASVIVISILGLFLKLVVKVPVIRSIDAFFGMLFGAAEGFIIVWILCLIIGLLVEQGFMIPEYNDFLYSLTDSSYLLKFFCELSPIDFINIRIE